LKKKLASLKRLEKKFEASMDHQRTHINLQRLYKKLWIRNRIWSSYLSLLKKKERVARGQIELRKRKREVEGKKDVA